jgi:hypothetical protein
MIADPSACPAARQARTASRAAWSAFDPGTALKILAEGFESPALRALAGHKTNAANRAARRTNVCKRMTAVNSKRHSPVNVIAGFPA